MLEGYIDIRLGNVVSAHTSVVFKNNSIFRESQILAKVKKWSDLRMHSYFLMVEQKSQKLWVSRVGANPERMGMCSGSQVRQKEGRGPDSQAAQAWLQRELGFKGVVGVPWSRAHPAG